MSNSVSFLYISQRHKENFPGWAHAEHLLGLKFSKCPVLAWIAQTHQILEGVTLVSTWMGTGLVCPYEWTRWSSRVQALEGHQKHPSSSGCQPSKWDGRQQVREWGVPLCLVVSSHEETSWYGAPSLLMVLRDPRQCRRKEVPFAKPLPSWGLPTMVDGLQEGKNMAGGCFDRSLLPSPKGERWQGQSIPSPAAWAAWEQATVLCLATPPHVETAGW